MLFWPCFQKEKVEAKVTAQAHRSENNREDFLSAQSRKQDSLKKPGLLEKE